MSEWTAMVFENIKELLLTRVGLTHIAGSQLEEAIDVCRLAAGSGWLSTLCPWNSAQDSINSVLQRYRQTLKAIIDETLPCQLSIKPVNFGYDVALLRDLLDAAAEHNVTIQFDSMDLYSAPRSFALLEQVRSRYSNIGCTLPARWKRSFDDAERMVEMQIPVRIVKGQWGDPSNSGGNYQKKYLALVDVLAGRAARIAIATHNKPLAEQALQRVRRSGTPCELEQMIGLPSLARTVAKPSSLPIRLYVPYGHPYVPYNFYDVWNRPRIAGWVARDLLETREQKLERLRQTLLDSGPTEQMKTIPDFEPPVAPKRFSNYVGNGKAVKMY